MAGVDLRNGVASRIFPSFQRCWESHALGDTWGMQAAFIDGHTQWVDVSRIHKACAYGDYNLDWTWEGIRGRDID